MDWAHFSVHDSPMDGEKRCAVWPVGGSGVALLHVNRVQIYKLFTKSFFCLQFEESMIVYDACRLIRERVPDAASGQRELWWAGWGVV